MTRLITLLISAIAFSASVVADPQQGIAESPLEVHPLLNSQLVPSVTLKDHKGEKVSLNQLAAQQPTLLVFYRGGWCPFCNQQLASLQQVLPQIKDLGYQVAAISPDTPERLNASRIDGEIDYTLLSDNGLDAIRAFGLAFFLEDSLAKRYRDKMGSVFATADGTDRIVLPVPAVYLLDTDGKVQFSYVNPDYRVRMPETLILEAAKTYAPRG
ncbi:peroxiredoxin-like family protein [Paraferrimonas sedimenticola]|uniref:thioredoxin-dependent peroxiredoxin n=1 Tax=Paraferrimonas sedimenticola TaxID=375674 RepID=A0AA37RXF8_9GAMM|nr:peroxiredoxin-like family protein [Paraferrimonas sedimenticola]GLP97098.1 alkyl hydroperoxide reductase [Paraferrimonas sedimenticola]